VRSIPQARVIIDNPEPSLYESVKASIKMTKRLKILAQSMITL